MNNLEIEFFYHFLPVPIGKDPSFTKIEPTVKIFPIMELNNTRKPLIHKQNRPIFLTNPTYLTKVPSYLTECLERQEYMLKPKNIHNSIELVVGEGHLGDISDHIVVPDCWEGLPDSDGD